MVYLFIVFRIHYNSMHIKRDDFIIKKTDASSCISCPTATPPGNMPLPLVQKLKILVIYNRNFALRKKYLFHQVSSFIFNPPWGNIPSLSPPDTLNEVSFLDPGTVIRLAPPDHDCRGGTSERDIACVYRFTRVIFHGVLVFIHAVLILVDFQLALARPVGAHIRRQGSSLVLRNKSSRVTEVFNLVFERGEQIVIDNYYLSVITVNLERELYHGVAGLACLFLGSYDI